VYTGVNKYLYNGKELQDDAISGSSLNWYDYGARMYDPAIGRFHTQDRFAEKYFDFTPYQYGANNPIKYIDINGDSLWVSVSTQTTNADGTSALQTNRYYYGQDADGNKGFIGADGKLYTGSDQFVSQVSEAIEYLSSGPNGSSLVDDLVTSANNTEIKLSRKNMADLDKGSFILWNPNKLGGGPDLIGGSKRPAPIGLGHEMAHVQDVWNGTINKDVWYSFRYKGKSQSILKAEIYATHIENLIRSEHSRALRVSYGKDSYGNPDPNTRIIFPATSKSIYYNTNGTTNYIKQKNSQNALQY